jgi:hypothetical protein
MAVADALAHWVAGGPGQRLQGVDLPALDMERNVSETVALLEGLLAHGTL